MSGFLVEDELVMLNSKLESRPGTWHILALTLLGDVRHQFHFRIQMVLLPGSQGHRVTGSCSFRPRFSAESLESLDLRIMVYAGTMLGKPMENPKILG